MCDRLIVGVTTDELVSQYKDKKTVIPYEERSEIIRNIQGVDCVVPQSNMDKFEAWQKYQFDVLIVGDDWYRSDKWNAIEEKLRSVNVRVFYLPYTKGTSSTKINQILDQHRIPL
ncbi:glycerol-3-phosphate cytidylyltransferase [Aliiglaciecola lipolytica E3]|uniref:Glycerol-3-phosphate cytidylyltransferase n=2 Tax=Aliiglaciecola TaxID=1406885 RepID=K6YAJ5_9ALTE|nr:glycerol-3-phosphate cytidylyltransferase [Aliiglaciecola lipolytica E3]